MILHVVTFRFRPGVTEEERQALLALLDALPARIPAVAEYRFGPDLGLAEGNADFAISALVADEEALREYLEHPHERVREQLAGMTEERTAVQLAPEDDVEAAVRSLYAALIAAWNGRAAEAYAGLFARDGVAIGFDGSEMRGADAIAASLREVFASHPTAPYVVKVRSVREGGADHAVLRAVAGMAPPGTAALDPGLHAQHSLVAERRGGGWRIVLFQNTPAQFHGRPEAVAALTAELEAL